jgi:hypothetical protein
MTDTKRAVPFPREAVRKYALANNLTQPVWEWKQAPAPEWQASAQSKAASQQYLDSKRRVSVAPWFFGGLALALGMLACAALDAFLRGPL